MSATTLEIIAFAIMLVYAVINSIFGFDVTHYIDMNCKSKTFRIIFRIWSILGWIAAMTICICAIRQIR